MSSFSFIFQIIFILLCTSHICLSQCQGEQVTGTGFYDSHQGVSGVASFAGGDSDGRYSGKINDEDHLAIRIPFSPAVDYVGEICITVGFNHADGVVSFKVRDKQFTFRNKLGDTTRTPQEFCFEHSVPNEAIVYIKDVGEGDILVDGSRYSMCISCGDDYEDSDRDGVCDPADFHPNFDNALLGSSCDDGDVHTVNDRFDNGNNCRGAGQIVINEIFITGFNGSEVFDHGFKISDWIEIYNGTSAAIDLTGWFLSDSKGTKRKWMIPSGSIPANGYRVFYANGLDDSNVNTNFKIDQGELTEEVLLTDPLGNIVDEFEIDVYTQQEHSRGRVTDGADVWGVFDTPTLGASNQAASDYSPYVDIDMESGAYNAAITVTINVPAGFTARYTVNTGNNNTSQSLDPTVSSTAYSSPLTISNTTVLKVRLFDDAGIMLPGFIETNTYLINENHGIYVLSVSGKKNILDLVNGNIDLYPTAHMEMFDESGELVTEVAGNLNKHGQDSWQYPHRGFDIFARDEVGYGGNMKHKFFEDKDRTDFDRFIIRAAGDDNYPYENGGAHIRDAFVQEWGFQSGLAMDHRSYRPCVVYLNGRYWGVYEIREKVVHKSFTKHYFNQDEDDLDYISYWGGRTIRYGSPADWDATINYINSNNMGNAANFTYVDDRINLLSWTDYVLFNNYIVSKDWNNYNSAWWRGRNPDGGAQKWRFILWDMDASFGHYINYSNVPDISPSASPCDVLDNSPIFDPEFLLSSFEKIFDENPDFKNFVANRYNDLLNTYWSCDYSVPLLDAMILEKEPEMARQFARWNGTNAVWQNNVQDIRDFLNARCAVIDDELNLCLDLGRRKTVTFQTNPPNILASIKTNTIVLPSIPLTGDYYSELPVEIEAIESFYYEFSHWEHTPGVLISDLNSQTATMNVTNDASVTAHYTFVPNKELTINEIHYNPNNEELINPATNMLDTIDGHNFEFIELKNTGTAPIDLYNLEFSRGFDFRFEQSSVVLPGDFIVLADDSDWFQFKYGFAPDGIYLGELDNSGEGLQIQTQLDVVDSLTYNDKGDWPNTADKGYYSVALKLGNLDNSDPANWAIQSVLTTPGEENYFEDLGEHGFSGLVINEIHYNPFDSIDQNSGATIDGTKFEFVEIQNISVVRIYLEGTFFARGIDYVFAAGTFIDPGDFIVLADDKSSFEDRYGFPPFDKYDGKLDNGSETLWLVSGSGVLLDAVTYDDMAPWDPNADGGAYDYSLALINPNIDNDVAANWKRQCTPYWTPGQANNFERVNCGCPNSDVPIVDADNDGVCDDLDQCPGADDAIDVNGNGIPDACENCVNDIVNLSNANITSDEAANFSIQTNGIVQSSQTIDYHAGVSVEMIADFEVKTGALYHAYIALCDQ